MRPTNVRIVEVGARDGLQNEPKTLPTAVKVTLIRDLIAAGLTHIEAGSFVSPKWVPQMADTAEVMAALGHPPGVILSVLTPNLKGLEGAIASRADEVVLFSAASEAFSQRNTNCSIAESIARFREVARAATAAGIKARGSVSVTLGCPYEGEVPVSKVVELATALIDAGCYEVSLADTIGVGTPLKARAMVAAVAREVPVGRLGVHFHDTYGQALANVAACLEEGITVVDSAVAGLGGCPFAKGAAGNVATEDVVYMLQGMGIETGVDLGRLAAAGRSITAALGRTSPSKVASALAAKAAA